MSRDKGAPNPEIRKIIKVINRAEGWRIERTRCGWKFFSSNGHDIVTVHNGSSDKRHVHNIKADLKRAGLDVDNPAPARLNNTGACRGWAESDLEHQAHLEKAGG